MASLDLKTDRVLTLLEVGKTPIQMALKPDGGELFVNNFDSNSFSIVEAYTNEVGGSYLIGSNPVRGVVTSDNTLLYVSNFGVRHDQRLRHRRRPRDRLGARR